ncbi:MAG: carboxypeptidase-like regulatory domain-containing protein, partial [Acidobacteriota bacterium]
MKKRLHPLVAGCLMCAIGVASSPARDLRPGKEGVAAIGSSAALATVVGTVRDESGKPLIGAIVALLEPHSRGRALQSVKTDLKGRFSAAVAPGAYRLRATADGFSAMLTRINLDGAGRMTYDIALRRTNTLVQKRGDSDDYRWIARSVPRHVLNLRPNIPTSPAVHEGEVRSDSFVRRQPTFHGLTQFMTARSSFPDGGPNYFGLNFAVSGSLDGNIEMALIGQRGTGQLAPQRLMAIASMRTSDQHKITASVGYGQTFVGGTSLRGRTLASHPEAKSSGPATLDQVSVTALGEWQ